ncbi:MAG: nucleotide exchange factor GrpE, partial [Proteobacteria bacterium]|nr:nucleotide exchange factor GrpE [Pseudomonadota bacterium]
MTKRHLHPTAEAGADTPDEPTPDVESEPPLEEATDVEDEVMDELAKARAAQASAAAWYQSRISTLQADLANREEKLHEYIAAYKAAVAEMDAVRDRLERDKEKVIDRDRKDLVGKLLDLLDNFDRSLGSIKPGSSVEDIVHGLTMVRTQFSGVLGGFGVERMETVGSD